MAGTIAQCIGKYSPAGESKCAVVDLAIAELVDNAFRHAPPGTVTLTVNVTQRLVAIQVVDSGGGFDLRDMMVKVRSRLKADPSLVGSRGLMLLQHFNTKGSS